MTVKEIFELRKQGKIEQAYEAIKPLYAVHKGKYTTLCMFWTASDIFKKRLAQGRAEEAGKILEALKRMLPRIEAIEHDAAELHNHITVDGRGDENIGKSAISFIRYAERRLTNYKPQPKKAHRRRPLVSPDAQRATQQTEIVQPEKGEQETIQTEAIKPLQEQTVEPAEEPIEVKTEISATYEEPVDDLDGVDTTNSLVVGLDEGIIRPIKGINAPQRVVLACLTAHPGFSVPQISTSTGIPAKSIERHVSALIARNLIEHRGSKKTGGYYAK